MSTINENGQLVEKNRNILEEIAACTRKRITLQKEQVSLSRMKELARSKASLETEEFPFEQAICKRGMSFICEIKRASPSKGLIAKDFPYLSIAKEYEMAGASGISCLTEPTYFMGENAYLKEIAREVTIPILRKDFTIDEYMVYEAKVLGASAILLIGAILTKQELHAYYEIATSLGMSAIFEVHNEQELEMANGCGARIVGVNNRNLKTFTMDLSTTTRLRRFMDDHVRLISESGIQTREDIAILEENKVDAVLIGETLMRASNKKQMLEVLKGVI